MIDRVMGIIFRKIPGMKGRMMRKSWNNVGGKANKEIMKAVVFILVIVLIGIPKIGEIESRAADKTISGFDFICDLMEKVILADVNELGVDIKERLIEIVSVKNGVYYVKGTEITKKAYEKYMKTFKLPENKAALLICAVKLGIADSKVKKYKKAVTVAGALGILSRADEVMHGDTVSPESIAFCINNRISDIKKVKKKERNGEAEGYIRGFVKGNAKTYSHTRTLKGHKKLNLKNKEKLLGLLVDKAERYSLSPDFQITRSSKLPRNAELYAYILDSFPNSYYETGFNGMSNKNFFDSGMGLGADSLEIRMQRTSFSFVFPSEIEEFNALEYPSDAFPYKNNVFTKTYRNNIVPNEMVGSSEEFYRYALNVDYRTVEEDEEWLSVMRKYLTDSEIEEYIRHCKENKTVIECDLVAADRSSVYWYNGEYQCKVYAHMRVVSDVPTQLGKTMGTDQEKYGYLYPVKKGYETGVCYTRSVLGPLYLDYQLGEWIDYYVNTSGCADFYGSLCCTNTERGIMIDYTGMYPWLVKFPFLK